MSNKKISQLDEYTGSPSGFTIPGVTSAGTRKANLANQISQALASDTTKATKAELTQLSSKVSEFDGVLVNGELHESYNLFRNDESWYKGGKFIKTNGTTDSNVSYVTSGFIAVDAGDNIKLTSTGGNSNIVIIAFYSSESEGSYIQDTYQKDYSGISSVDVPTGANYMLVCGEIRFVSSMQVTVGECKPYQQWFAPYRDHVLANNIVGQSQIKDGSVSKEKVSFDFVDKDLLETICDIKKCYNLLDKDDSNFLNPGRFVYEGANIYRDGNYIVSGYIEVEEGKEYCFAASDNTSNQCCASYQFYDESKARMAGTFNSSSTSSLFSATAPSGAKYLRVCLYRGASQELVNKLQVTEGEQKPYKAYFEPYYVPKVVGHENISKGFGSFRNSGELSSNETITTLGMNVRKNTMLNVNVGEFEKIIFGVGYGSSGDGRIYMAHWIEVTHSSAKLMYYDNVSNKQLGDAIDLSSFTFGKNTSFMVVCDNNVSNYAKLRIANERGNEMSVDLQRWGYGKPFVTNKGTSAVNADLSFIPSDIAMPVWVFGDSMTADYSANNRWTYYLLNRGQSSFLLNALPGLSPADCYANLINMLTAGAVPKYLFWLAGGNGQRSESLIDGVPVISSEQKKVLLSVKEVCNSYGISLVVCTWPNFASRSRFGYNNFVRSNFRYVDIASSVGCNRTGVWTNSPTMFAWKSSSNVILYTPIREGEDNTSALSLCGLYGTSYAVDESGDNAVEISSFASDRSSIVVNGVTYARYKDGDIGLVWNGTSATSSGLLDIDGLHPTRFGAVVQAHKVLQDFPEIAISD